MSKASKATKVSTAQLVLLVRIASTTRFGREVPFFLVVECDGSVWKTAQSLIRQGLLELREFRGRSHDGTWDEWTTRGLFLTAAGRTALAAE